MADCHFSVMSLREPMSEVIHSFLNVRAGSKNAEATGCEKCRIDDYTNQASDAGELTKPFFFNHPERAPWSEAASTKAVKLPIFSLDRTSTPALALALLPP
jgi:hypothetical protein